MAPKILLTDNPLSAMDIARGTGAIRLRTR